MITAISRCRILRFRRDRVETAEDVVAVEYPVEIHVNKQLLAVLHATPRDLEALAIGYLMTEGFVRSLDEILDIHVEDGKVYVRVSETVDDRIRIRKAWVVKPVCGGPPGQSLSLLDRISNLKVDSDARWSYEEILNTIKMLNTNAALYRKTGGVHAALLVDARGLKLLKEDVGRHNAVDKVVGSYVLKGFEDFGRVFLACSGRLSSEMVLKAARVGIPLLASISAPTSLGLALAERFAVTLVGFVRGLRFNVYSYPDRIIFPL